MRQIIIPLLFGLAGVALLVGLGVWQMQRLEWKEGVLADIEARIAEAPVSLPPQPVADRDLYLPVTLTGSFGEGVLRVLVSRKQVGAGYLIVSPFVLEDGRRVLVDRGFVRVDAPLSPPPPGVVTITGNLNWPDDRNASTPDNDLEANTWFARDIDTMAATLDTEAVLVVARDVPGAQAVRPLPVTTEHIPNDHLEYAVTWFSLAAIWLAMTGYYIHRSRMSARDETA